MGEHSIHLLAILLLFLLSLGILYKDQLKFSKLKVLILIFLAVFTLSHVSCCDLSLLWGQHATPTSVTYHPCCMGQVSTAVPVVSFEPPSFEQLAYYPEIKINNLNLLSFTLHNKSPPTQS